MLEQLVLSSLGPSILSDSTVPCEWRGDSSVLSKSRGSKGGQGPSLQLHKGIATDGNGLQETGQNISEETEATRFFRMSGVEVAVDRSESRGWSMHGVQNPRESGSFISFSRDPGSFTNEMIPCRQSGQGMDPGGPTISEEMLHVEQRYSAHLTQSWCPQPA